jgi:hypothetical protein
MCDCCRDATYLTRHVGDNYGISMQVESTTCELHSALHCPKSLSWAPYMRFPAFLGHLFFLMRVSADERLCHMRFLQADDVYHFDFIEGTYGKTLHAGTAYEDIIPKR